MGKWSDEHLEYTIRTWQEYFPYKISKEKAAEICDNVVGFVKPLLEAKVERLNKEKQQNTPPKK
jgi:hypothetical protein